mmetsp:Transcript_39692/g.105103  ORF Transcript_39692/g.105103 Transcript_39692/m.105103 type:complete len:84 (+) Transcript_39692:105-356(+)|eukprot:CAMPEP_0194544116 /NCGR_PEP_ID=MMETSP0253-20130528/86956_1 /TAXON_ID=2966 /ORGANISM="Noctiluca scintillans" /LENGTH=83 /DNA_ID=CAMNT_0039390957 /DNA_START=91 /DNA_END=342 /DNA_ORIENTATION=-
MSERLNATRNAAFLATRNHGDELSNELMPIAELVVAAHVVMILLALCWWFCLLCRDMKTRAQPTYAEFKGGKFENVVDEKKAC